MNIPEVSLCHLTRITISKYYRTLEGIGMHLNLNSTLQNEP
jgi:hypothetical protein